MIVTAVGPSDLPVNLADLDQLLKQFPYTSNTMGWPGSCTAGPPQPLRAQILTQPPMQFHNSAPAKSPT